MTTAQWGLIWLTAVILAYAIVMKIWNKSCGKLLQHWRAAREARRATEMDSMRREQQVKQNGKNFYDS